MAKQQVIYKMITKSGQYYAGDRDVFEYGAILGGTWCWDKVWSCTSTRVVIALYVPNDKIIGVFRFYLTKRWNKLTAEGSWVHKKYRRKNHAVSMWKYALRRFRIKRVDVTTVSDRGFTLLQSLKDSFPSVRFNITDDGQRPLRDMR